jgi:hypothetical protein
MNMQVPQWHEAATALVPSADQGGSVPRGTGVDQGDIAPGGTGSTCVLAGVQRVTTRRRQSTKEQDVAKGKGEAE